MKRLLFPIAYLYFLAVSILTDLKNDHEGAVFEAKHLLRKRLKG